MVAPVKNYSSGFKEWASLFSETLFVFLQVYADESGTHATAPVTSVCGFIESPEKWETFRPKWKKVLDDFGADHFHFREFSSKDICSKPNGPYPNWSHSKRRAFLYRLALTASLVGVPIGGASNTQKRLKE